jgi:hypothetical protein
MRARFAVVRLRRWRRERVGLDLVEDFVRGVRCWGEVEIWCSDLRLMKKVGWFKRSMRAREGAGKGGKIERVKLGRLMKGVMVKRRERCVRVMMLLMLVVQMRLGWRVVFVSRELRRIVKIGVLGW